MQFFAETMLLTQNFCPIGQGIWDTIPYVTNLLDSFSEMGSEENESFVEYTQKRIEELKKLKNKCSKASIVEKNYFTP